MPIEITLLGWSVVLLLLHTALQGGAATLSLGIGYNLSARDEERKPDNVYAGRLKRALSNYLETYPAFVALALALVVANKAGGWGTLGAEIWFWGRVAYLPLYALGVPVVRTLAWCVSLAGLVMMLLRLFSII